MRQKYGNMTLRVVFSMSKEDEAQNRIKYILKNVDYLHLIQTTRSIAVKLDELNVEELLKNESNRIDQSKFTFTRTLFVYIIIYIYIYIIEEAIIDGVNSIDTTIQEAFKASSVRSEDEIILIWGVFWSSIKLLSENYEVDIPPAIIPTYHQCSQLLVLPSRYKRSMIEKRKKNLI